MEISTKELNIFYAEVFLDSFTHEESIKEDQNESEQFRVINQRFHDEYQWCIDKKGQQEAFKEWLQGLAIAIPYSNNDILSLAQATGHFINNPRTHNNEYKILANYFNFMACKFFYLLNRKQSWFDDNLNNAE